MLCEVDCIQETLEGSDKMADKSGEPTNVDIIAMLTKINIKFNAVDNKFKSPELIQEKKETKVEGLENKVDSFNELKRL